MFYWNSLDMIASPSSGLYHTVLILAVAAFNFGFSVPILIASFEGGAELTCALRRRCWPARVAYVVGVAVAWLGCAVAMGVVNSNSFVYISGVLEPEYRLPMGFDELDGFGTKMVKLQLVLGLHALVVGVLYALR